MEDSDDEVVVTDTASSSGWVIGMADVGNPLLSGAVGDKGCGVAVVCAGGEVVVGPGGCGSGISLTTAFPSSYSSCAAGGRHG